MVIKNFFKNIYLIILLVGLLVLPFQAAEAEQPSPALLSMAASESFNRMERIALELDTSQEREVFNMSTVTRKIQEKVQPWIPVDSQHLAFVLEDPSKEPGPQTRTRATCTVTSAADSGVGTLRECMTNAGVGDTILFDPTEFPPGAPATISLNTSNLPYVTVDDLTIDASNAGVILDGNALPVEPKFGFVITQAQGVTIRGFQITGFTVGVLISDAGNNIIGGNRSIGDGPMGQGNLISNNSSTGVHLQNQSTSNTTDNLITGNFIGTDLTGTSAFGMQQYGVVIGWGASQNVVGGTHSSTACEGACNVISGNIQIGVLLREDGTTDNQVLGNFIGTNADGTDPITGQDVSGVMIAFGASGNDVGGSHTAGICDDQCNLISANNTGIQIQNSGSTANNVLGNFIGTDITGNIAVGPQGWGVINGFGASDNIIGGSDLGEGNLISGNTSGGVLIRADGTPTTGNQLFGNFIGTNAAGNVALPNAGGVLIDLGATNNQVGGNGSGEGNLISGNINDGISVGNTGTNGNQVLGNKIGTDVSGSATLPNLYGITIGSGAANTVVGGALGGAGNLISGNANIGLWVDGETTSGTQVLGNQIGTDISGTSALPNYEGIIISTGSTGNQIGGTAPGAGNLVSGNYLDGILLQSLGSPGNTITGNKIGTNAAGTAAIPNYEGIYLDRAAYNTIGGTLSLAGNIISGNADSGVYISASDNNQVKGNKIGTDVNGTAAIPNADSGVYINGSSDNIIGGGESGAGNLISGNSLVGILVGPETSLNNQIFGNKIGTNLFGSDSIPNQIGIGIVKARETLVGEADISTPWVCDGSCNLISGNSIFGILIQGIIGGETSSLGEENRELVGQLNKVQGNFIGTDLVGNDAVPNVTLGISLDFEANGNLVGGSSLLGEGNLISGNNRGIVIRGVLTDGNQIAGNRIGTTFDGNTALGNGDMGVIIQESASNNVIGGEEPGMGNLISGHHLSYDEEDLVSHFGLVIETFVEPPALNNQVIGNFIGTNAAGTGDIANSTGIWLNQLVSNTVVRDNIISGNALRGMFVNETGGNEITDNLIGVASDGTSPLTNQMGGVVIRDAQDNILGPGNIIAFQQFGVTVVMPTSLGNTITRNSIYSNSEKQISFFEDSGDPLIPLPVPTPVLTGFESGTVSGTACAGCQVEVFANPDAQPAGKAYLGTATTDGGGSFSLVVGTGYIFLSATATDSAGTTSEFSESLQVGTLNYVYLPLILK